MSGGVKGRVPKVLISTSIFGEYDDVPIRMLEANGFEIVLNPFRRRLKEDETISLLKDIDGLIAGTEVLSKEVLDLANSLRVISRCGSGMDNIDVNTASARGIKLYCVPDGATEAVAELTLALILDLLRKIAKSDRDLHMGIWKKEMGLLLEKKTLGILGLGHIGRRLLELIAPFHLRALAHDIQPNREVAQRLNVELVSFEEVLRNSDVVSIHIPYTSATHNLLGRREIGWMKRGAILINTSRGRIVAEEALVEALRSGQIGGAALDVFKEEPYTGELRQFENVVLTPHIGSYAKEARIAMEHKSALNLLKGFGITLNEEEM